MRGQTKGASQSLCCSRSLNSYMTGPAWSAGIAAGPPATSTLRPHKWPEDSGLRARFGCCKRGVLFPQIPPPPAVSQSPRNRPQDARLGPAPRQRWGPAGGGGNVSGLREALRGPRCPRLCPQVTGMMGTGAGGGGAPAGEAQKGHQPLGQTQSTADCGTPCRVPSVPSAWGPRRHRGRFVAQIIQSRLGDRPSETAPSVSPERLPSGAFSPTTLSFPRLVPARPAQRRRGEAVTGPCRVGLVPATPEGPTGD